LRVAASSNPLAVQSATDSVFDDIETMTNRKSKSVSRTLIVLLFPLLIVFTSCSFEPPIQTEVLLSYGNVTQPGSPHRGDQLQLLAEKELRPAWRTREEVEANLERSELLEYKP
jgi:hypothetical protein